MDVTAPGYKPAHELERMARVKRAFDPDNLMNPGKVIPADFVTVRDRTGNG